MAVSKIACVNKLYETEVAGNSAYLSSSATFKLSRTGNVVNIRGSVAIVTTPTRWSKVLDFPQGFRPATNSRGYHYTTPLAQSSNVSANVPVYFKETHIEFYEPGEHSAGKYVTMDITYMTSDALPTS